MTIKIVEEVDFDDLYHYCEDTSAIDLMDDISNEGKVNDFMDILCWDNPDGLSWCEFLDFVRYEEDFIREKLDLYPDEDEDDDEDEDEDNDD